ncbi:glycoprotein [Wuhan House Fly Virus 2]|uniref:Glycoprotein n=1 Tax=Wuhan House Fly Virus 2 TaxID=1608105 RepID=A0A0B5KTL0_9RHAB|nr:glycoprotein [Wuhan House Fly Virus 2]AJG39172.1 glycoprotein [Wuhan House Fly Virus 2]
MNRHSFMAPSKRTTLVLPFVVGILSIFIQPASSRPMTTGSEDMANSRGKTDCFALPESAEDWDIKVYDMSMSVDHPIPSRPQCKKPSEPLRTQIPAIISVFSPDFSEYSKVAYKFDKILIVTSCKGALLGSDDRMIIQKRKLLLTADDENTISKACGPVGCQLYLKSINPGESKIWPEPEEYSCKLFSTTKVESIRFIISSISMQINSDGSVVNPGVGSACRVTGRNHCIHQRKQFGLAFHNITINECAAKLKLIAPGVLSLPPSNLSDIHDEDSYVTLPEQMLSFWFRGRVSETKVRCNISGVPVRESADGYLIGISSVNNATRFPKSGELDKGMLTALEQEPFRSLIHQTPKARKVRDTHLDKLQRSYSRAELQYGLDQIWSELKFLRKDINYEFCKVKAQLWDNAFIHLWDNPDIFANYLYPLEKVKGIFHNNMLKIIHGKRLSNACIPRPPVIEGVYMKLMIKGQPHWLRASTGELLSTNPKESKAMAVASFVIPTLPQEGYDIIQDLVVNDHAGTYLHPMSNQSLYFSRDEMHTVQELSWTVTLQESEDKRIQDLSSRISSASVSGSFDEYVATPLKETWHSFSNSSKDLVHWTLLGIGALVFLYLISHIVIPLYGIISRASLKRKSNALKEEKIKLNKVDLKAF